MSAQGGIWNYDGKPIDRKLLANFLDSLKRQGPDNEFFHVQGPIAFLYCPFHTTAESRREVQPYLSRRGFVITWEGRLDNREELTAEYRSNLESNPTDIAIVAAAFDHCETNCFSKLIGDWAVCIWNAIDRELIFAIDYMAVRHIFYYLRKDCIWWSTDLAPLVLLSGNKFHIDEDYIGGYFANDADAHLTAYREIRAVPPGQFVRVHLGTASVERYWRFSPKFRISYKTDAEYEDHFRDVFRQAVRRRLRSDSPILAELSGGVDSSSIVCMADDILAKEGAQTPGLGTLSYYDKTEPSGDDWVYFQKVEEHRGKIGAHIDISKYGESASFEYPGFSALPGLLGAGRNIQAERAAVVRNCGYRAALSGVGGDEFMGGIPNPKSLLADLIVQFRFVRLAKDLVAWSLIRRQPWIKCLWHALLELLPPFLSQYLFEEAKVEPWIEKDFARLTRIAIRQLDVEEHFGFWLPTRRCYISAMLLMANNMSKRIPQSVPLEETRYPYLDQQLIEFVLSIPASQLLRPGERRSLLRRSLVGVVPQEILSRRTKQVGARTPRAAVEKNLEYLKMAFDSPLSSGMGFINRDRFWAAVHGSVNGQHVNISRLMKTMSLELWLRDLVSRRLIDVGVAQSQAVLAERVQLNA